jgi:hypothetical protein
MTTPRVGTVERHSVSECDRRLRARPDYSAFRSTPAVFVCECGRRWEHVHDEAEGDFYACSEVGAAGQETGE